MNVSGKDFLHLRHKYVIIQHYRKMRGNGSVCLHVCRSYWKIQRFMLSVQCLHVLILQSWGPTWPKCVEQ